MKTLVRTAFVMGPKLRAMVHGFKGLLTPAKILFLTLTFSATTSWAYNDFLFRTSSFSRESRKDFQKFDQDDRLMLNWSLRSAGESYADQIDEDFVYAVGGRSEIKYRLLDRLIFTTTIDVQFRSGRVQSRFGEFTPSGIYLHYGYFDLDILNDDMFHLMFGTLDQRRVFSGFVMAQRSFPGLEERVNIKAMDGKMLYRFSTQQVIPTSYTFNTELVAKEELPTLFSAVASATYESGRSYDMSAYVGGFSYNNLPSKVADSSRFLGNSVIGTGAASQFIFGFEGWMAGIAGRYDFNRDIAVGFSLDMLENTSAPDTFNQAQMIRVFASRRLNADLGLDFNVGNYFVESDAVPGYYTSTVMGNTNRKGNFVELGLEWIPKKVRVSGRYVKADLINKDTSGRQYDADIITIHLETSYDRLF
ncbi:MAG: hypothetical protein M9899_07340 [Bdellovibrionaceae bacterium]|nr:hypothetical protein [Pseudobdellovibrionaceae bacterium]